MHRVAKKECLTNNGFSKIQINYKVVPIIKNKLTFSLEMYYEYGNRYNQYDDGD